VTLRDIEVDHIVWAAPDLEAAAGLLRTEWGVSPAPGGRHEGEGTRNALVGLGPAVYLEIVGPDPSGPRPGRARWFGVDGLAAPRLAAWAVRAGDLEDIRRRALRAGVRLGGIRSGSRRRADSLVLAWRFTDPRRMVGGGVVPFFIDWGNTPHPARGAPAGADLVALRAEHPDPVSVRRAFDAMGIALAVEAGPAPAVIATVDTPLGRKELR
jgi:Glyoxalase-like domain